MLCGASHRDDAALEPVLVCRARSLLVAFPVTAVLETMRPLPVAPLAGAPAGVLGVAVIRGAATPVVDVGALLGLSGPAAPARFVTVRTGAESVALAVEEVDSVRTLPREAATRLPLLYAGDGAGPLAALGALDAELLAVLEATRILPGERLAPPVAEAAT